MESNLIILLKVTKENTLNTEFEKNVRKAFDELYQNVTDSEFTISIRDQLRIIRYKLSLSKSNMIFLKLICDASEAKSAEALSSAINILQQGDHRKAWNIVVTYDEASLYYCSKLMWGFGEFDRKTREFIYITLIKMFGGDWYNQSFHNKEMTKHLKSKKLNTTDLIEKALNELDYNGLKDFLFAPYPDYNINEIMETKLSHENIESMSKEEIITVLNKCRPEKSLWERFFSQYKEFDNFEETISELQNPRNSVMHHKQISKKQFDDYKKKLKAINSKLDRAIEILENEIYADKNITDIAGALSNFKKNNINNISSNLKETFNLINNLIAPIVKLQNSISESISSISRQYDEIRQVCSGPWEAIESVAKTINSVSQVQESIPKISVELPFINGINMFEDEEEQSDEDVGNDDKSDDDNTEDDNNNDDSEKNK